MADKRPSKLRLKLSKADTNRLKTDTGRQKKEADEATSAASETVKVQPPGAGQGGGDPEQTSEIMDPMSLRDSSAGRLRRLESADAASTAVAPAAGEDGGKTTETVRLKIVREKKKQLSNILTASQTIHLRPSNLAPPTPGQPAAASPPGTAPTASVPPPTPAASSETVKVAPPKPPAAAPPEDSGVTVVTPQISAKSATATLKIRPKPGEKPPAPPKPVAPPRAAASLAKGGLKATSTLKIRPPTTKKPLTAATSKSKAETAPAMHRQKAPDSTAMTPKSKVETAPAVEREKPPESKLKLTPSKPPTPAAAEPSTQDTQVATPPREPEKTSKLSLSLKKPKKGGAAPTMKLPGVGEAGGEAEAAAAEEAGDAKATVAVSPPSEDAKATVALKQEPDDEAAEDTKAKKKPGLKLKSGKKPQGAPSAVKVKEEKEKGAAAAATDGPGAPVMIFSGLTVAALLVLTALVAFQFWVHILGK